MTDRGVQVGLIGAVLVAVSPFLVYYSQETRMYSALATFGILSTYALWKLLQTRSRRWFVAYVGWSLAVMYTQYFGALVLIFQGIYLLGTATRTRRSALLGLVGLAATGIGYLPWVYGAYRQISRLIDIPDFWKGDFQLSYMLTHVFAAFALGGFGAIAQMPVAAGLVAALLIGGVGFLGWRALRNGGGELFVLTYLLIPLVLLYAIVARNPKFTERYLIMIAPPFYLVFALVLVAVARWGGRARTAVLRRATYGITFLIGLGLVFISGSQLLQIYNGPGYRKDDNRGAIAYIEKNAKPGDVTMLMMNTYQSYVYYSDGTVPWEPLQPGDDLSQGAAGLNRITAGHRRLWVLLWNPEWADPTNWVRESLNRAYRRIPVNAEFAGLGLELYEINPSYSFSVKTAPDVPERINYGNQLALLGYDLKDQTIQAGKTGRITFYWDALVPPVNDYIISVRLTDGRFYWWRHDDRPAAFNYPTTYWRVGQVVAGQREFEIPAGTPPGKYSLEVGVYGQGVGSDLNVLIDRKIPNGTSSRVATIDVTVGSPLLDIAAMPIPKRLNESILPELKLVGSSPPPTRVLRGGTFDLSLWWQALKKPAGNYDVAISFLNGGNQRSIAIEPPAAGKYPTSEWMAGEVVIDKHRFVVPNDSHPGPTQVLVQLMPHGSAGSLTSGQTIEIGTIDVVDRKIAMTPPPDIQKSLDFRVGEFARLVGTALSTPTARPGDHLRLTLFWQAMSNSGDIGYTAFAHLLDAQNLVKAQQDHPPGTGDVPTTGWTAGEYITDQYDLRVASDATPGTYVVEVGMYNPATGGRLTVVDSSGNVAGDRVVIGNVQVK